MYGDGTGEEYALALKSTERQYYDGSDSTHLIPITSRDEFINGGIWDAGSGSIEGVVLLFHEMLILFLFVKGKQYIITSADSIHNGALGEAKTMDVLINLACSQGT